MSVDLFWRSFDSNFVNNERVSVHNKVLIEVCALGGDSAPIVLSPGTEDMTVTLCVMAHLLSRKSAGVNLVCRDQRTKNHLLMYLKVVLAGGAENLVWSNENSVQFREQTLITVWAWEEIAVSNFDVNQKSCYIFEGTRALFLPSLLKIWNLLPKQKTGRMIIMMDNRMPLKSFCMLELAPRLAMRTILFEATLMGRMIMPTVQLLKTTLGDLVKVEIERNAPGGNGAVLHITLNDEIDLCTTNPIECLRVLKDGIAKLGAPFLQKLVVLKAFCVFKNPHWYTEEEVETLCANSAQA